MSLIVKGFSVLMMFYLWTFSRWFNIFLDYIYWTQFLFGFDVSWVVFLLATVTVCDSFANAAFEYAMTSGRQRVHEKYLEKYIFSEINEDKMKVFHKKVARIFKMVRVKSKENKNLIIVEGLLLSKLATIEN